MENMTYAKNIDQFIDALELVKKYSSSYIFADWVIEDAEVFAQIPGEYEVYESKITFDFGGYFYSEKRMKKYRGYTIRYYIYINLEEVKEKNPDMKEINLRKAA